MSTERSPFDPTEVDQPTLAILLEAAGWTWDYWGKFYSPGGHKYRDLKWVLADVKRSWSCPDCACVGCDCCGPGICHADNPYHDPSPCTILNEYGEKQA